MLPNLSVCYDIPIEYQEDGLQGAPRERISIMNSTEIKALDKERIVSTYARQDMVAATGKGSYCYDVDGKKYVDFTAAGSNHNSFEIVFK